MSALPISITQYLNLNQPQSTIPGTEPRLQVLDGGAYLDDGSGLIKTYNTDGWTYLDTDIHNEFAIFESDTSWCIALINLRTGEWFCDSDPLFPVLSFEEDEQGEYILDHRDMSKLYLSGAARP